MIQKRGGFREAAVPAGVHDDGDQCPAISCGGCGQAALRGARVAGLDADGTVIGEEEMIGIGAGEILARAFVVDLLASGRNDLPELFVLKAILRDLRHVAGGRVVILIRHAVRIDEVCACCSDGAGFFIHHGSEMVHISADGFCDGAGRPVIGDQHHLVGEVSQTDPFAAAELGGLDVGGIGTDGDGFERIPLFQGEDAGHHLRHAGGVFTLVRIFFIEDLPRPGIDQDRGVSSEDGGFCIRGKRGEGEKEESEKAEERFHVGSFRSEQGEADSRGQRSDSCSLEK